MFVVQLFSISSVRSETCEAIVPANTTAKLGEKAVLRCRHSSQNIAWTFCPRNGAPKVIVSNCNVLPSAADNYRLDKTANACNLIIDNVTVSHLGTYTCQDLSLNDPGYTAELGNANENFALRKPAIQSTLYVAASPANNAVDGSIEASVETNKCAVTLLGASQWWAVDLGQETPVGRVRITSRIGYISQLQNFFVGLTNVSPWTTPPPKLSQSSVCKFFAGHPPDGIPINIFCDPDTQPGRYLFVLATATDHLSICEVEAYYK
jgi:hypothetical protein